MAGQSSKGSIRLELVIRTFKGWKSYRRNGLIMKKITQVYRVFQTLKVQYFGAIAIHYKITHCWVELPPDKVELIF